MVRCHPTAAGPTRLTNLSIDAGDVKNSPLFLDSDPIIGLGGWGDPAKDIQVQDGAFRNLQLAYPVPHTLRRNFTLQPYVSLTDNPIFTDPTMDANVSFTPGEVQKIVDWTPGDFPGMQFYMERPEGPHGSVHEILGGCVLDVSSLLYCRLHEVLGLRTSATWRATAPQTHTQIASPSPPSLPMVNYFHALSDDASLT